MDELKEYLHYDPATGIFTWIKKYYANNVGDHPKPSHSEGYIRVQFKGVRYFLHVVAFYWTYGYLPSRVDHKNRITSDNRLENLRAATDAENACNTGPKGRSKYRGLCWQKNTSKWVVILRKAGQKYYLGVFSDEKEAARAYNVKAREIHGEFAYINEVDNG